MSVVFKNSFPCLQLPRSDRNVYSSVSIATGYGMDGPEIEFRWGARFSAPVQTGCGAHSASCTMGTASLCRPGGGFEHPPYPAPRLKRQSSSVFPNLFDVAVPLTSLFISHGTPWGKKTIIFKLIYFLIISYLRDITVYCCWVSIYSLINDVEMNVI